MAGRLAGKVAIVTGGASGIGEATCRLFVREGVGGLVLADINDGTGKTIEGELRKAGGDVCYQHLDVSRESQWIETMKMVDARWGRLDVLVNNAGIGRRIESISAIDDETWRRTMAVNLDGAFYCLRAAIPRLRAAGGGRIVNVSSGAARTGGAIGAHYAASKAGMLALTAKAARELAREGISVNAVLPSMIETDMLSEIGRGEEVLARLRAQFPIGRFGRPEEVARVVRFLCIEAPDYLTGECISLRGARL
jgi:3-oxoacyl-[acyl-carrier protein] reductase